MARRQTRTAAVCLARPPSGGPPRSLAFAAPFKVAKRPPADTAAAKPAAQAAPYIPVTLVGKVFYVVMQTTSAFVNGSILGALVGVVTGAWGKKTWVGARTEAMSAARSWGGISGVYTGLTVFTKAVRGVDDNYNAVIGACGSGAVFSLQSGPRAALQGCATFALFSYVVDMFAKPREEPDPDMSPDEAAMRKRMG